MQSFDSAEGRHPFVVDGTPYYLTPYGFADVVELAELAAIADERTQVDRYRAFVASRARSTKSAAGLLVSGQKSPRRAVMSLQPKQLTDLFKAWTGAGDTLGESSGSQSPSAVTDEN